MNTHSFPFEGTATWFALDLIGKATLLILLATGLVLLSLRSSAALRHRVWSILFMALLLLPAVSAVVPGWAWHIIPSQWQAVPPPVVHNPTPTAVRDSFPPGTPSAMRGPSLAPAAPNAPIAQAMRDSQPV